MRWSKRVLRNDTVRALLCVVASLYIRLAYLTGRWEKIGYDIPDEFWRAKRPFVFAFWHGRLLMMTCVWPRDRPMNMLASQHRDGQMMARIVSYFGIRSVAGSSTKGGLAALRGLLRVLKAGEWVGVTPDGPGGPRMRASSGVVNIARMAGVPIIPAAYSAEKRFVARSWDRFVVPLPFSKGVFVFGRPIEVPKEASEAALEALREEIEVRLNALTLAADSRMGHAPIDPAPRPEAALPS